MKRLFAGLLSVAAILLLATPVFAADPPTLSQTVTDQTGKLANGTARIDAAATSLKTDHNLTLYVAFLNSIDGEEPGQFVERTAAANNLTAGRNVLLLVSLNDRKDAVWSSGQTSIDTNELTSIRTGAVEPKLKAGDFVGAVEAAAVGFGNADAAVAAPPPVNQPAPAPSAPVDFTPLLTALVVIVIFVLVGSVLFLVAQWTMKRLSARAAARAAFEKMEALGKQAHVALMQTDEQVRSAEQELAYAQAEFGDDETAPFKSALDVAKQQLQDAFRIGQKIDDEIPESYDERSQLLASIVDKTSGIEQAMTDQTAGVERLRDLEKNAATTVKTLIAAKPDRDKALTDAQLTIDQLNLHGKSVADSVNHNVEVVTALYASVNSTLSDAQADIDAGKMAPAALLVRTAQDALAKAKTALDGVSKMGAVLDQAQRGLDAEIQSADAEIAKAVAAAQAGKVSGVDANLSEAKTTLAQAKHEAVASQADFIAAYNMAVKANDLADAVLDAIRDAQERERRAIAQAKAQMAAAQASLAQASTYIESNRGDVGRQSRTRLSEAQRRYQEASSIGDIYAAAAAAAAAQDMAEAAYRTARSDVAAVSAASYASSSSSSGGSYGSSSSSSSNNDSFSFGSFGGGGGGFSGGSFGGGGGGSSSGGGW